jgi:hypothetical protein
MGLHAEAVLVHPFAPSDRMSTSCTTHLTVHYITDFLLTAGTWADLDALPVLIFVFVSALAWYVTGKLDKQMEEGKKPD